MSVQWWVADALEKIFPDSAKPVDAAEQIELWVARNETEDVQVALAIPPKQRVSKATYKFSPLQGPRGQAIASAHCRAWWEWPIYVHANPPQNSDPATYLLKAPAFFPDAFLEEAEVGLRGGVTQPVWISVEVPPGTPPGAYRGRVEFALEYQHGRGRERITVPMSVHVWPFTLPVRQSLRHTEWFFPRVLAEHYGLEPWSEAHWSWIEKVARDMAAHRQDMILTDFSQLVQARQVRREVLDFNFARLDRWLNIFCQAGLEWIEGGHIAHRQSDWGSPFVYQRWPIVGPDGKPLDTSAQKMSEADFQRCVEQLLKATHGHLRERGLAERYVQHVADEPTPDNERSWRRISANVHRWLPGVRRIDAIMSEGMEGYCEIGVPQIQHIMEPSRRKAPEELWSYVCLAPQKNFPNRFIDYPSIRNRIIYWLSWTLNLKGFLHWGYSYWQVWGGVPVKIPLSPWMDATGGSLYCRDTQPLPAGDPFIVYPGRRSICSSIRWETVRKGFEDYEYLNLLDGLVSRPKRATAAAREQGRRLLAEVRQVIARDPARHTHDARRLQAVRRAIGATIAVLAPEKA